MHRCQHSFKKIPSNLWVVRVGSISFQEISYAGKPQVVSRYILSNLWCPQVMLLLKCLLTTKWGPSNYFLFLDISLVYSKACLTQLTSIKWQFIVWPTGYPWQPYECIKFNINLKVGWVKPVLAVVLSLWRFLY